MNVVSESSSYRRVLLKLSGEILGGEDGSGFDATTVNRIVDEIHQLVLRGVQVGVVIGGGNFHRGRQSEELGISRVRGDQIGMLCTIINAFALEQVALQSGAEIVVQSVLAVPSMVEQYDAVSFEQHFQRNRIVVFAGGTGNTHVTTDSGASLRAVEINADILLKGTKVDGIYSAAPDDYSSAIMYNQITFDEVLSNNLEVMDAMAVAICRDNNLPIRVFNANQTGAIIRAGMGESIGTLVNNGKQQC